VSQTTGGCESLRSEIVVTVNVLPTINITNPPACLTGSTTYSLEVTVSSGNVTSTSGIVSNISGNIWSIAEITSETDIDVTVTGINGCQEMISVDAPLCITDVGITINTGISPNGDGVNDEFRIIGLNNFPQNTLQIFNRWGVKVFERDRYEQPGVKLFDGTSYGRVTVQEDEKLPVGTYYYVLNYQDASGTIMSKAGYFYITR
jgi:gliding motility-associated-like protein